LIEAESPNQIDWGATGCFEVLMSETSIRIGRDWRGLDIADLKKCAEFGITLEGTAVILSRDILEVERKASELGLKLQPATRASLRR